MMKKEFNKKFNKILGKLEAEIMEIVWYKNCATVRCVLNEIKRTPKPAYTTIMTVMSRLCEKGLLTRKLNKDDAYIYRPVQDKESFFATVSRKIISGLINDFGEDVAVAQFIDVMENSKTKNSKVLREKLEAVIN